MADEQDRWELLADTAEELNEVLGLEPAIKIDDTTEEELEAKIEEASGMVMEEDEFTEQTEEVLAEFLEDSEEEDEDESEETEEDESEEEPEEEDLDEEDLEEAEEAEEDSEEFTLQELREYVEDTKKRKDLRIFAQEFPDTFASSIEKMNDGGLRSGKALKGSMLSELDEQMEGGGEEAEVVEDSEEEESEEEEEQDNDSEEESDDHETKSAPGDKSNKEIVYEAWDDGEDDAEELLDLVDGRIKKTTIQNWMSKWRQGNGLPASAKQEEE